MSSDLNQSVQRRRAASGFTLLELIIVLVVLAALAALVIPTLGFVRDQANFATSASGAAEVLNNLELYKSATGRYPQRFDSLVNTSGSYYTKAHTSSSGAFPYGEVRSGSSGFAYYYLMNSGMTEFMQHDEGPDEDGDPIPPNNSTDNQLPTTISHMNNGNFVFIDPANVASSSFNTWMAEIIRTVYPNQTGEGVDELAIPVGHSLIALGVGSRTGCVGSTMTSAPVWSGAGDDEYGRYIALFDVSPGGERGEVKLKAVVDSKYRTIAANIKQYKEAGPKDDQGNYVAPPPVVPDPE